MTKCSCYLEKCQPTTVSQVNCHELPKYYLNYGFFGGAKQHLEFQVVRGRHAIHLELWARVTGIPTDIYTAMSFSCIPYVCILFFCYTTNASICMCIYIYSYISYQIYILVLVVGFQVLLLFMDIHPSQTTWPMISSVHHRSPTLNSRSRCGWAWAEAFNVQ